MIKNSLCKLLPPLHHLSSFSYERFLVLAPSDEFGGLPHLKFEIAIAGRFHSRAQMRHLLVLHFFCIRSVFFAAGKDSFSSEDLT